jgi:hypothetical protein
VARGLLDNVEQVFMFVSTELDDLVEWAAGVRLPVMVDYTALAREREAHYLSLFEVEPPFVTVGAPPPASEWRRRDAATGPKSGPITMAPTMSTGLSTMMPQAAIIAARAMNTKNDGVGVASSRAWASA